MSVVPSENPLNAYVDPGTIPNMSVDGLIVNKRYAVTGIVDSLNTTVNTYASPQTSQANTQSQINLANVSLISPSGYTDFPKAVQGDINIFGIQIKLKNPTTSSGTALIQNQQVVYCNYISFDFMDVPANWSLWYLDPLTSTMLPILNLDGSTVEGSTFGSNPFSWLHNNITFQTIFTNLIEIRMDRNIPGNNNGINNVFYQPYSFGINKINISLNLIDDYNQVPDDALVYSISPLGTSEQYIKNQRDASQIQSVNNRTNVPTNNSYWKSKPQPYGDAIVCLYIDLGAQETIDTMFLDPLYSGVAMNVYYSIDNTIQQPFYCSRKKSQFTQKDVSNPVTFLNFGEQIVGPFGNTRSGASIPNTTNAGLVLPTNLQIDGTKSWAMGVKFTPNNGATSGTLISQLNGASDIVKLNYSISGSNITFSSIINSNSITKTITVINKPSTGWVNPPYSIVFGYDNSGTQPFVFMYINTINNLVYSNVTATNYSSSLSDTTITLGNTSNSSGGQSAKGVLLDYWIRQDSINNTIINQYINYSRPFINCYGPSSPQRGDYNALFLAPLNGNYCYVGPSSHYYESKSWTPLPGNFQLRRSTYKLSPFNARYIKLEFTNLKPENYSLITNNIQKTYKRFPQSVLTYFSELENIINSSKKNNYVGSQALSAGAPVPGFNLSTLTLTTASGNFANYQPPTLAEINSSQTGSLQSSNNANQNAAIIDPSSNSNVGSYEENFLTSANNNLPFITPKFTQVGIHSYDTQTINQTWQQSYFVGLKSLQFYKEIQTVVDDTEYYYDNCTFDYYNAASLFDSSTATLPYNISNIPQGYVATASGQLMYTKALSSFTPVSSFQIAANHSDWVNLTPTAQAIFAGNNLGYLTLNNCAMSQQINSFNLTTGVYQFDQSSVNASYGIQTSTITSLPSTITDCGGMRMSAFARFLLPNTAQGSYQLNFYVTINGVNTQVGSKTVSPGINVWTDLQVDWTIPYGITSSQISNFYATFNQTNILVTESFYITVLSICYNPVSFAWTTDKSNFYPISSTINNPIGHNAINYQDPYGLTSDTNLFYIRIKTHAVGAYLSSILIAPQYSYNAHTPNVSIDYYPDPRTNEVWTKVPVFDQPLFQLSSDFFPIAWSKQNTGIS